MAQIQNVITTVFRARGGQAIAEMGGVTRGMQGIGRSIQDSTRMSERFNTQMRAIGTTIRYAFAGGLVFGLKGMVDQLSQVQTQMGMIAELGTQPGGGIFGRAFSGQQVKKLGFDLQQAAANAITPISDLNDATVTYLSTVQNADPGQLPKIMQMLSEGATLAQTPVDDLTAALTSMNNAFGRPQNLNTISQLTRQWQQFIAIAPGAARYGPQIAQQFGPLSQVALLGSSPNVNPAQAQSQLFTLALGSMRFGGTPATSLRGLQYFMQSLAQPPGKASRRILMGMGITPQFMHDKGFYAATLKFLRGITLPRGADIRRMNAIPDDQIDAMDTDPNAQLPGIPPQEMQRLRTAIGRVHGVRAAVTLAYQLRQRGGIQSLDQILAHMQQVRGDQGEFNDAWRKFAAQSKLKEAANAVNIMRLQVAQAVEPLLNFAATGVTGAQRVMHRHPHATQTAVRVGAGLLAGTALLRFLGAGKWPGLNRIPGIRGLLGGGLGMAQAGVDLATNGGGRGLMQGRGNTPALPIYVTVVTDLSGGGGRGGAPGLGTPIVAGGSRFGRFGKFVGPTALTAGILWDAQIMQSKIQKNGWRHEFLTSGGHPLLSWAGAGNLAKDVFMPWRKDPGGDSPKKHLEHILNAWSPKHPMDVTQIYRSGEQQGNNGKMYATFDINVKYPDGTTHKKRVHVPVDIWTGQRTPSNRGTPANTRSK